jgi:hypothetical protein|tara:strand:- start:654 stop:800 length:147 start_codon:yes stop_codon:yes gene_type:complete
MIGTVLKMERRCILAVRKADGVVREKVVLAMRYGLLKRKYLEALTKLL